MPRRSGSRGGFGGGFGSRSSSPVRRSSATAQRPQPQPVQHTHTIQYQRPGMMSGLGGMLMSGMAFGAGSEVAHSAIRSMQGSGQGQSEQSPQQQQAVEKAQEQQQKQMQLCGDELFDFTKCLKDKSEISMCQNYMDVLKECQRKNNLPQ